MDPMHHSAIELVPTAEGNCHTHTGFHLRQFVGKGVREGAWDGQWEDHIGKQSDRFWVQRWPMWEHRSNDAKPGTVRTRNGGQHFLDSPCLIDMKRKRVRYDNATAKVRLIHEKETEKDVYDLSTPLWNKYYQEVRKTIRFPRYYKRSVNW
jgi:hypothetical protein